MLPLFGSLQKAATMLRQSARPMSFSTLDLSQFPGVAQPLPTDLQQKLLQPVDIKSVSIKPDGILYLSQHEYRRILNEVFGLGGWALLPRGEAHIAETQVRREYALFVHGRFISQAIGEQDIHKHTASAGDACEGARSNALMRCCKDLGIGSELWQSEWSSTFKQTHCVNVWVEHSKTGERRQLWRRKDASLPPSFWKELSGSPPSSDRVVSSSSSTLPPSSSSSSSSTPSSFASSASSLSGASLTFDPEGLVPSIFKKYAGKPWIEVLATTEGRNYLNFLSTSTAPPMAPLARRALEFWDASHNDEYEGV